MIIMMEQYQAFFFSFITVSEKPSEIHTHNIYIMFEFVGDPDLLAGRGGCGNRRVAACGALCPGSGKK